MGLVSTIYGQWHLRPANNAAAGAVSWPAKSDKPQHERPLPKPLLGRVWLRVPFEEKDQAKAAGAHWDGQYRFWWTAANKRARARCERWLPRKKSNT